MPSGVQVSIAPPPESRHRAIKLAIQVGENGERLGSVSGRRGCGMELANHRTVTTNTGLDVYFCDPHSSWQRGTNENTNGLLGRYRAKSGDSTRHEARVFLDRKWVVLVA